MNSKPLAAVAVAAGLVLGMGPAQGQTAAPAAPARNANVYDGRDHQPTRGEVQSRERADGMGATGSVGPQEGREVDTLYRQLMGQERPGATQAPPGRP